MQREIAIIGSGVVGLCTALTLAERQHRVTVFRSPLGHGPISSRVAPAVFTPYPGPIPQARYIPWLRTSLQKFDQIARHHSSESGVFMGTLREYFYSPRHTMPWIDAELRTQPLDAPVARAAGVEAVVGKRYHIDTTRYIDWLESQVAAAPHTEIISAHITSLHDSRIKEFDAVVNCSGLHARELTNDPKLVPMRGVVLHVPDEIGLDYSLHDDAPEGRVAYIFKYPDHIVLGGTFEPERIDTHVHQEDVDGIIERCRALLRLDGHPRWAQLSADRAMRKLVALRPARLGPDSYDDLRLELDLSSGQPIVHHYGHGRQGISVSWGTATEAAAMLEGH